jgi:hypothetical protein
VPIINPTRGMDFLGATNMASAATSSATVTIAPRDLLVVLFRIPGYGGSDIVSLRFNADSGSNYATRFLSVGAGGTTLSDASNVSQTLMRLAASTTTNGRSGIVIISNIATQPKIARIESSTWYSASVATASQLDLSGFGVWNNTSAQITSMQLVVPGGQTMNANTGFAVFGRNLT